VKPLDRKVRILNYKNPFCQQETCKTLEHSLIRISFGIGAGVKLFPHSRFGIRVQAQWLPIWVSPKIKGFVCGGGVALGGKVVHQGEVSVGPFFRF
jgi:hypothetical protein